MLARDRAVDLDQLLDGSVARIGRDGRQLGNAVANRPAPEVSTGHVEARPRIAAHVADLDSSVGHGAVSYWGYEVFLKRHESNVRSLIGVSGCLYAVRRSAYVPLYHEACSDFIIATKMVEQGLRAVYESQAICEEETNRRADKEFVMRVRVITQTYNDLWRHRHMLNPLRAGIYAVELFSHKVMRYLVPVFLGVIFVSSLLLAFVSPFYLLVFLAQLAFYFLAFAGYLLQRSGINARVLALPHYFLLLPSCRDRKQTLPCLQRQLRCHKDEKQECSLHVYNGRKNSPYH